MNQENVTASVVRIEALCKSFGERSVLKDINITVPSGQAVVLVGSSGSGKTTCLRCVNRLEEPTSGRIFIGDTEITAPRINLNAIRRRVGMVFQQINLYPHLTALGNVSLALRKVAGMSRREAEERALHQLAGMDLADRAQAYPHELSGGQQQRVGIARAMALDPEVMLFDEPTSALDPELVGEVLKALEKTKNDGMTMMVVTHEMQFAREMADRVVFMDAGSVLADGSPDEIFLHSDHERIKAFLNRVRLR
jgi:ABC-type polar amino acid transport system ATPase subunit